MPAFSWFLWQQQELFIRTCFRAAHKTTAKMKHCPHGWLALLWSELLILLCNPHWTVLQWSRLLRQLFMSDFPSSVNKTEYKKNMPHLRDDWKCNLVSLFPYSHIYETAEQAVSVPFLFPPSALRSRKKTMTLPSCGMRSAIAGAAVNKQYLFEGKWNKGIEMSWENAKVGQHLLSICG